MRTSVLAVSVVSLMFSLAVVAPSAEQIESKEPVDIGSRRELFVDDYLIDALQEARRILHHPTPQEVSLVRNKPWEGNSCSYTTVFQDAGLYRMYYRGSHMKFTQGKRTSTHREVVCYAESTDGVRWTRPELGLVEFEGSKKNSIIWDGVGSHCFTPFKDPNPDCPPEMKYKAVGRGSRGGKPVLFALKSSDGIHWSLMTAEPVITKGAFDSQNLAFWDSVRGEYRAYLRDFRGNPRTRDIRTCTSRDFVEWSEPVFLKYTDYAPSHVSQFYTNVIIPYYRAPHLFLWLSRTLRRLRLGGINPATSPTAIPRTGSQCSAPPNYPTPKCLRRSHSKRGPSCVRRHQNRLF